MLTPSGDNGSIPPDAVSRAIVFRLSCRRSAGPARVAAGPVQADRYIFSHDPDGTTPWRPDYATLAFARLADRLGIAKIRLHDLRHFAATTMLLNGIDVRTAAGRLGHARASTTLDIYAHYTLPADQRASDTLASSLDTREASARPERRSPP